MKNFQLWGIEAWIEHHDWSQSLSTSRLELIHKPWTNPQVFQGGLQDILTQCAMSLLPHLPLKPISSVQSLSHVRLFATPWIAARQASLSITNSRNSLRFMSIELVMLSSHLILCRPCLLLSPIPPSIKVFSNESTLCMGDTNIQSIAWTEYAI